MNVCVIGAGPAGVAAIRQLLAEGHTVRCFEKDSDIGGVFKKGNSYDSLLLTISNYFMAYSDFMPFSERLKIWTGREYEQYLHRYADHYGLMDAIAFGTEVASVRKRGDSWLVATVCGGETFEHEFDAVAVCSGHFQKPNIPEIKGLDRFTGRILHAIEYRNPQPFEGRRVLCVGLGETSSDVTSEISTVARECTLSLRRYQAVAPRYMPFQKDPYFTIDSGDVTSRIMNSFSPRLYGLFRRGIFRDYLKSRHPHIRLRGEWLMKAGPSVSQVLTKNERVFEYIADGKIQCNMAGIESFEGNKVFFKNGESREIDDVVFCTGFKLSFPFLDREISNTRDLYKQMFLPDVGKSLAFIGFARPLQGGVPAIAEMQSRYFAALCSGEAELPSPENMTRLARADRQYWEREFHITPHVSSLVNYCHYMDDIARLVKCSPVIPSFISDPVFYTKMYLGPQFAIQYRLNGARSLQKEAYDFLKSFPVMHTLPKIVWILLVFWLSKIIPVSLLKPKSGP
uniref:Dimethylaniline monooxygenase (N-oxide forming) n=1 Tax=Candidatus Kentrum sp. FW TaxID=2126338 RepID=A0A450S547_9GAMM|nr:MAG: dimethylaniline monooxygenase (N-oxide forming) [Candidatus Kentron sp. FW]VFJ56157.1 MAG: dimethylaniline monooxygenase (N-oxide forming) [Candidatus Kentron sp. FW]